MPGRVAQAYCPEITFNGGQRLFIDLAKRPAIETLVRGGKDEMINSSSLPACSLTDVRARNSITDGDKGFLR